MILETLEAKAKALGASFFYATKDSANVILDELDKMGYPAIIVIPINVKDKKNVNTGALESTFELVFWALDKYESETNDFDDDVIEVDFTQPMRTLARQFVNAIDHSDMINEGSDGIEDATYNTASGVMDAHLFGVQGTCTVPIIEQLSVCDES
jgi:hypothetical protein